MSSSAFFNAIKQGNVEALSSILSESQSPEKTLVQVKRGIQEEITIPITQVTVEDMMKEEMEEGEDQEREAEMQREEKFENIIVVELPVSVLLLQHPVMETCSPVSPFEWAVLV